MTSRADVLRSDLEDAAEALLFKLTGLPGAARAAAGDVVARLATWSADRARTLDRSNEATAAPPEIAISASVSEPVLRRAEAAPLGAEAEWDRATRALSEAVTHRATAVELQGAARERLDQADYALRELVDELSTVMAGIARASPTAVVVRLEPQQAEAAAAEPIAKFRRSRKTAAA